MEIKYTRGYTSKDGRYTAGEINLMLGKAMEIIEPRPMLTEGKLGIGEICVILFGITPEEYALRNSDSKAFDALAARLRRNVPADRLIALRVMDLKGAPVKRDVKLKTGESVDDGAFAEKMRAQMAGPIDAELLACAKIQKLGQAKDAPEGVKQDWERARQALGAALTRVEKLIVADDALTGGRFPSMGFDGRVELFTTMARANRVKERIGAESGQIELWTLREIPRSEFTAYFRRCMDLGISAFRVDNGFAAAELKISDILSGIAAENALLRVMIVREIEYGTRFQTFKEKNMDESKTRAVLAGMLSFRNFAFHELGSALLYAACIGTAGNGAEMCTQLARAKLDPEKQARIVPADRFMVLTNPSGKRCMAVFTSRILAAAFAEKREENVEPVAITFDDVKARVRVCDGVVIDPETLGYWLTSDQMDKVIELRGKPPQIVVASPQTNAPQPKPAPEAGGLPDPDAAEAPAKVSEAGGLPDPDAAEAPNAGGLPDPDAVKAPAKAPETVEPEPPRVEEKPAEKKGFLRKLFGKKD